MKESTYITFKHDDNVKTKNRDNQFWAASNLETISSIFTFNDDDAVGLEAIDIGRQPWYKFCFDALNGQITGYLKIYPEGDLHLGDRYCIVIHRDL